ncbi:MAG: PAS domain S-box protein [Deltaproteobacteria bacterium]|nr:PAS domain S-box protein [Deltaproteobacteria bacterium]
MNPDTFYTLLEQANEAIFVAQDGKLVYLNPATARAMGYTRQELLTRPFSEFIHPDDRAMIIERYQRRLQGEKLTQGHPFRVIHKDGRTLWVELHGLPT